MDDAVSFYPRRAFSAFLPATLACSWVVAAFAAEPVRRTMPFTSPPWPPTRKGCTTKGLGPNPDPAYLSACFYAWFEFTADLDRSTMEPRALLDAYSTPSLRAALLNNDRSLRTSGQGVKGEDAFLLFDEFKGLLYDFHVINATFDPDTGIADVQTTLRGFHQSLFVRFVRVGSTWRVDDVLPHYDRDKTAITLKDYLSVYVPWKPMKRYTR